MRAMTLSIIGMLLSALSLASSANVVKPASTKAQIQTNFPVVQTEKKLPHKIFLPGDHFYPEALSTLGVQGEVKLQLELSDVGKVNAVRVLGASKSNVLDDNALAFVKDPAWKLPEGVVLQAPRVYTLNLIFLKDSSANIDKKTCADFNTDLNYFRSVQAGSDVSEISVFEILASLFTVRLMKAEGAEKTLAYVRAHKKISQDTAKACAEKPKALLLKTYIKAANQNHIKF
jgi:TonB family protein